MIAGRQLRLTWAAALIAAAGAALALAARALLGGSWFAAAAAIIMAAILGHFCARPFTESTRRYRTALLERARGEISRALPRANYRELTELGNAADVLAIELTRRADRLEQQRSHLATLVESVSEGLLRIAGSGRIEYLNPAARELLGLPPGAEGQQVTALVRSGELRMLLGRVLQGEQVNGAEVARGDRRLLVSARPLESTAPGERTDGAVIALADLTRLRRLEGVRRDFVANVSHELKTPLTSIRGYAETLLSDDVEPEIRRQFLETVRRNAERLQRIVDELLDLSIIESGAWRPEPHELSVGEVVADVWASCRDRAPRVAFSGPDTELRVVADPNGLRQVLSNLIDNAIRYTPDDGAITVTARRIERNSGMIAIEVLDHGTGIPSEHLPRIFERFYRVDPARSRAAGGTGLGLAIVKHLVESMGGAVEASSELGKGTTIRFTLPAA